MNPERTQSAAECSGGDADETFETCLQGCYDWGYAAPATALKRLYRLAKVKSWDAEATLTSGETTDVTREMPDVEAGELMRGYAPYDALPEARRVAIAWRLHGHRLSALLHGEQAALMISSQLVTCAQSTEAKLFAASQVFDEARHVEFFAGYLSRHVGAIAPCHPALRAVIDLALCERRVDVKLLLMQVVLESLALASFQSLLRQTRVPVLRDGLRNVLRDESRHVAFGLDYLKAHLCELSTSEREERAVIVYDTVKTLTGSMNDITAAVRDEGWPMAEVRRHVRAARVKDRSFDTSLYSHLLHNLQQVGLLTDRSRARWQALTSLALADLRAPEQLELDRHG